MTTEDEYEQRAYPELRALLDALDALELDGAESELASDILSIEFSDGAHYVINSHRAARQIWMAAERSAWHFDYSPDAGTWTDAKTGGELWATVAEVLSKKLGRPVALGRG